MNEVVAAVGSFLTVERSRRNFLHDATRAGLIRGLMVRSHGSDHAVAGRLNYSPGDEKRAWTYWRVQVRPASVVANVRPSARVTRARLASVAATAVTSADSGKRHALPGVAINGSKHQTTPAQPANRPARTLRNQRGWPQAAG